MGSGRNTSKSAAANTGSRILWQPKVWAGLFLLAALGVGGHFAWQRFSPVIARHPQYQITAERIHITPPPSWIRSDVKAEVLRDSGLVDSFSLLDDSRKVEQHVRDAFVSHPWVAAVRRITMSLPASIDVELDYRRPVAAVEAADRDTVSFLPIDVTGIRLPDADFSDVECRYLPRIAGVVGRPGIGQPWSDPRVIAGAELATRLADVWSQLRLVEIIPSLQTQARGDARFYTFEIVTSGGTRIVWGAPPGQEQNAAESPFDVKRQRLMDYASQKGLLDSIDGPASVDVRSDLVVKPRTARRVPTETK